MLSAFDLITLLPVCRATVIVISDYYIVCFCKAKLCLLAADAQKDMSSEHLTHARTHLSSLRVFLLSRTPSSVQNASTLGSNEYCLTFSAFLHP